MISLNYKPLPTNNVRNLQNGEKDEHGHLPEKYISDGSGVPCRHCLDDVEKGDEYLILSYKPFESNQPFAEQGPIFLHAKQCEAYSKTNKLPKMYDPENQILLRGYSNEERIVYGTGQVVKNKDIEKTAQEIFATEGVKYIHARSATNNCFQYRIEPIS